MSKLEVDNWFFSDERFKSLLPDERLVLLLVNTHKGATIGVLSSKSALASSVIEIVTNRLLENKLVEKHDELFYMSNKNGTKRSDIVLSVRNNEEYLRIVKHLFAVINSLKSENTKELTPKASDYDSIRLMVEVDRIDPRAIIQILEIYHTIPFWGEKFIVKSASGLRKHWSSIYTSAQKHYNKNRIVEI